MRMSDVEILPCPFCAGEAMLDEPEEGQYYVAVFHKAWCVMRGLDGDGDIPFDGGLLDGDGIIREVEKWNRRA